MKLESESTGKYVRAASGSFAMAIFLAFGSVLASPLIMNSFHYNTIKAIGKLVRKSQVVCQITFQMSSMSGVANAQLSHGLSGTTFPPPVFYTTTII